MADDKKPDIDEKALTDEAAKNPKSKKWNNPNSRRNLKQYKDPEPEEEPESFSDVIIPTLETEEEEEQAAETQAAAIVIGRKLDKKLVQRLIPKRGILSPQETQHFQNIVLSFLSDFKNEEPTASDVDDIFEIAKCDVITSRLLKATKNSPDAMISVSRTLESWNKQKQKAKENLANRRTDRKDARSGQDINIVDLVARFDNQRRDVERQRVSDLLTEEQRMDKTLREIVDEEVF